MLPEYLGRISKVSAREDQGDSYRMVFGRDPRSMVWVNRGTLEKMVALLSTDVPDVNLALKKAEKFKVDIKRHVTWMKKRKGEIDRYSVWNVGDHNLSPYEFLKELSVLAFLRDVEGAEAFFAVDSHGIGPVNEAVGFGEAAEFLENFYGKTPVIVYDMHEQYRVAMGLIMEWLYFEKWLVLYGRRERKMI